MWGGGVGEIRTIVGGSRAAWDSLSLIYVLLESSTGIAMFSGPRLGMQNTMSPVTHSVSLRFKSTCRGRRQPELFRPVIRTLFGSGDVFVSAWESAFAWRIISPILSYHIILSYHTILSYHHLIIHLILSPYPYQIISEVICAILT